MSENTNIKPIPEWSPGFHLLIPLGEKYENKVFDANLNDAAYIIMRIALPLFKAKIRMMGTLDTSLVVRVKDCFCPLQADMFEFARANWLAVLSELEVMIATPEVMVREVKNKSKHLHFRFSVRAKAKRQFLGIKRYHWTGEEKHYED